MVNCSNLIIKMGPRFALGRENVPCVAEVVNRSLKADCTDFTYLAEISEENNRTTSFGGKGLFICRHIYLGKQLLPRINNCR